MSATQKLFLVIVLAVIGVGVYWFTRPPAGGGNDLIDPPVAPELTPAQASQAVSDFQTSLGYLENSKYEEALPLLEQLAKACPQEAVVHRHLALNYLVGINALTGAIEPEKSARRQEYMLRLHATLKDLEPFPAEEVPRLLIAARLAQAEDQLPLAMDLLEQAAVAAPQEASFPFELSEVANITGEESALARGLAGLEAAHKAQPQNLWVLQKLIVRQAEAKSPRLKDTLTAAPAALAVVQAGIQERSRVDVSKVVQDALAALEMGNWPVVTRNCRMLTNVILPEDAAQSDKIQLEKHPLEFVGVNLPEQVISKVPQPAATASSKLSLVFDKAPLPEGWEGVVLDVCVGDFDLNNVDDVCLLSKQAITVFGRDTLDGAWTKQTEFPLAQAYERVLAVDLDADEREAPQMVTTDMPGNTACRMADLDLVLYGEKGVTLLKNLWNAETKTRSWEEIPLGSTLQQIVAVTAGDVDIDGDLDLLVSGGGKVEQWSNRTGWKFGLKIGTPFDLPDGFVVKQFVLGDVNRDVDLDVLVVSEDGRCGLLENFRHGLLRYQELLSDDKPVIASRLAITDWNSDATWDVLAGSDRDLKLLRGVTTAEGQVVFKTEQTFAVAAGRFELADFANQGRETLLGTGDTAQFRDLAADPAHVVETNVVATHTLVWDMEQDGDLDVLALNDGVLTLLHNNTPDLGNWFELSLVADEYDPNTPAVSSRRMNHYAIGSTVEVRAGSRYQARIVTGPHVHFGLGGLEKVDTLRMVWTNGVPQHHLNPPTRALLCESQVVAGSCPYLYTQNSKGTHFVTDLLWAAPLGLPGPDGQLIPARPWEYIKIPGELLSEVDGRYRLQITEELREAGYYDEIRLYAIDHPAECEVHTNEKVGPPSLAEHKLHTVTQLRLPVSAVNQHGRDLLPQLSALDDDYARPYDDQFAHGVTEPTTMEMKLDVSDAAVDQPLDVKLFLTGWLHAPDAGVSTAIHESVLHGGTTLPIPQPLSLWVPNDAGEWTEAVPFTGFVGGKTKTMVLDIGAVLNRQDPRIQLRSSMEFSWDRIGYSLNEPANEVVETPLQLISADLHYRGFSYITAHNRRGPDHYDYKTVSQAAKFAPMGGRFTRYGNVLPLLTTQDDLLVVQGAGDELTLEFASLPAPREGWTRDFVIYSSGWDKDAQMCTVYGTNSEPYPFQGMSMYPSPEPAPSSPEYLRYLQEYQTRKQTGSGYRRALLQ